MGANGGVNGKVYAFMIRNEVVPVVKAMYATTMLNKRRSGRMIMQQFTGKNQSEKNHA